MPTIKTIKPAGGGDYTTLAAWWSARRTSGNADEWAECYVGNLDYVYMDSMTATPDATHYPKVYAAVGNRHNGVDITSGAYIDPGDFDLGLYTSVKFTRVELRERFHPESVNAILERQAKDASGKHLKVKIIESITGTEDEEKRLFEDLAAKRITPEEYDKQMDRIRSLREAHQDYLRRRRENE